MCRSRLPKILLNQVTLRNLTQLARMSLSYGLPHINSPVNICAESCVQDTTQKNKIIALQKVIISLQKPINNILLENLRIKGSNQNKNLNSFNGRRSIYSTLETKKEMQMNKLFNVCRRLISTKILPIKLDERVIVTTLKQMVESCKLKDGRYGKLIQIIGSPALLKTAYLMIKSNPGIKSKGIDQTTLEDISKKILAGTYKFDPVRRILIPKPGKKDLRPLGVSNPRQKIVQKSIDLVLTSIFEEIFLDCSHGFRPGRSCHTALKHLQLKIGNASAYT